MRKSDIVRRELARLETKHGRLTPDIVVDEARAADSPLHSQFDWDDLTAAHKHRLDTAREILTTYITVVIKDKTKRIVVPMYIRDASLPTGVQGYARTTAIRDRENAEMVLRAELDRIEGCIKRARAIADVLEARHPGIAQELELLLESALTVRAAVDGKRKRVSAKSAQAGHA